MNPGVAEHEDQDSNRERYLPGQQWVDQGMLRLNGWYGMLLNHVSADVERNFV